MTVNSMACMRSCLHEIRLVWGLPIGHLMHWQFPAEDSLETLNFESTALLPIACSCCVPLCCCTWGWHASHLVHRSLSLINTNSLQHIALAWRVCIYFFNYYHIMHIASFDSSSLQIQFHFCSFCFVSLSSFLQAVAVICI